MDSMPFGILEEIQPERGLEKGEVRRRDWRLDALLQFYTLSNSSFNEDFGTPCLLLHCSSIRFFLVLHYTDSPTSIKIGFLYDSAKGVKAGPRECGETEKRGMNVLKSQSQDFGSYCLKGHSLAEMVHIAFRWNLPNHQVPMLSDANWKFIDVPGLDHILLAKNLSGPSAGVPNAKVKARGLPRSCQTDSPIFGYRVHAPKTDTLALKSSFESAKSRSKIIVYRTMRLTRNSRSFMSKAMESFGCAKDATHSLGAIKSRTHGQNAIGSVGPNNGIWNKTHATHI
ncbi:hypothetical protein VNO77_03699 [Canavalia gladiata]|uniref:Uncharacterized protein n=1 Tax=Canavalia gladiata TaxID=3824 RepID=A0AAN9N1L8_CANGL